jgi:hypothetical protein
MAKIIGRLTSVGIGLESTRGTSVAPSYWVPVTGIDFDDKVGYIDNDSGFGRLEELNESDINQLWAEGSYEGKIFDRSVGVELCALFGATPTSVQRTTTAVYDHTFALAQNNQHKSLTLGYKNANHDLRYALAMINSWSIEAALDNYVRRTVSYVAKKAATASNTVAYINENEFIPDDITFKLATNLAGLSGASALKIISFNMEISKNAEALYVMGSNEPDDIANKQFAVEGSFEAYFDDITTYRDLVFANTKRALEIDIVGNNTIGTSGTHKPAIRFQLAKVSLAEYERGFDNNDIMTQTINFKGLFSIADTAMINARLTNEVVSY